jgi:DNA-binding CsgD family transcriptional regulator
MHHLHVFYLAVTAFVGLIAAALLTAVSFRENHRQVRLFLWTFLCFTAMIIKELILTYTAINIHSGLTWGILLFIMFSSLPTIWIWYFLLQLFHSAARLRKENLLNRLILVLCIAIMAVLIPPLGWTYNPDTGKLSLRFGIILANAVNIPLLVYSLAVGFYTLVSRWREKTAEAQTFRIGLIFCLSASPILFLEFIRDTLISRLSPVIVRIPDQVSLFPIFYILVGIGVSWFCMKELSVKPARPASADPEITADRLAKGFSLTEREREMIPLVLEGIGNKEMAVRLGIAVKTVNNHLYGLYKKLGINTRYELIGLASKVSSATPLQKTSI